MQIIAESIAKNRNFIITIVLCTANKHIINKDCKKNKVCHVVVGEMNEIFFVKTIMI
jgi:hypothetical protein